MLCGVRDIGASAELRPRSCFVPLPGGKYHLCEWGDPDAPLLLMLHGWMDVSRTFQFLVEALEGRWRVVAPDWLGYGLSEWRSRPYWLAELILDLDALANSLSPEQPLRIVGHSMGGNVASLWAGAQPHRLERLVMLEAFGHQRVSESGMRELHARWLRDGRNGPPESSHSSLAALEARLREANPRLSAARAIRIGGWLSRELPDGRVGIRVDPWQRNVLNHLVHQDVDFLSAWRCIDAPVLWVTADDSETRRMMTESHGGEAAMWARMAHFEALQHVRISESGHNVQHDQPEVLASVIEPFLLAGVRGFSPPD